MTQTEEIAIEPVKLTEAVKTTEVETQTVEESHEVDDKSKSEAPMNQIDNTTISITTAANSPTTLPISAVTAPKSIEVPSTSNTEINNNESDYDVAALIKIKQEYDRAKGLSDGYPVQRDMQYLHAWLNSKRFSFMLFI